MIKLWLIRHGKTEGNKLSRYIGTTDEPLCQEGTEFLHKMDYPKVQAVYVSPLKRCVQTAEILFPGEPVHIIEELAECDFGSFMRVAIVIMLYGPHVFWCRKTKLHM